MSRGPVFAGNWKMQKGPSETRAFFDEFLRQVGDVGGGSVVFFPPSISVPAAVQAAEGRPDIRIGVQNLHWETEGAFTGEISVGMAKDAGAVIALVGHSERRVLFGETIEDTVRKTDAALRDDLDVILCVGESLEEREQGRAEDVVREQLAPVLASDTVRGAADRLMVAYEPVWAIGTGKTARPDDAEAMHAAIRALLPRFSNGRVSEERPILYGGSVKPGNAADLLGRENVDGVLVGGASLAPGDFARICESGRS